MAALQKWMLPETNCSRDLYLIVMANQRRNFLRFLNRHELKWFLVLDDFHKRQAGGLVRKRAG